MHLLLEAYEAMHLEEGRGRDSFFACVGSGERWLGDDFVLFMP